jgi:hypothetical protein
VVLLFSCQGSSNTEIQGGVLKEFAGDTLEVKAPGIIFFYIGDDEYKKMEKEEGIDEILSDFNHYSRIVADSIKGIKIIYSNSVHFKIKLNNEEKIISRNTKENYVGVILADSIKAPVINYGVYSYKDYQVMINTYFKNIK